ncbi:hypothetical protein AVEN_104397-1 [Araneus ventricosus]|uniref:Uncharacterized protein n=1 Tax=Araneus ventricosus TaxID=182803 RepID=A0A4Y2M9L0_ARAVE|nr:hypothetical protein AVEN_104397-1 [Araneus ventricosus]
MSNPVPSTSKSTDPVPIASSSRNKNNISRQPSSETSAGPASKNASKFTIVKFKKKSKISSKNPHQNSVSLGLADRGIVHKDLPSIFGGVPQVPDLKLHPSDEDEDLQMNCDASETPPCVPTSNPPTLS